MAANHIDFAMTCPCCGGSFEIVNRARPTKVEALLVAFCGHCHQEWTLSVRLLANWAKRPGRDKAVA